MGSVHDLEAMTVDMIAALRKLDRGPGALGSFGTCGLPAPSFFEASNARNFARARPFQYDFLKV